MGIVKRREKRRERGREEEKSRKMSSSKCMRQLDRGCIDVMDVKRGQMEVRMGQFDILLLSLLWAWHPSHRVFLEKKHFDYHNEKNNHSKPNQYAKWELGPIPILLMLIGPPERALAHVLAPAISP